jgi:periplasmic protein TonB
VIVSFEIDKEGNVAEVKADSIPPQCPECAIEATRVIRTAPRWQHAIQYNRPVIYKLRQPVTFVVEEDERKKKKKRKD